MNVASFAHLSCGNILDFFLDRRSLSGYQSTAYMSEVAQKFVQLLHLDAFECRRISEQYVLHWTSSPKSRCNRISILRLECSQCVKFG